MKKPPFHNSVHFTIKGLMWILRNERNFQFHIFGLIINLFLIVFLGLSNTETALIILCCFFVLTTEAVNTCIEKICDHIQPEFDINIGIIKDLAGGAVLLSVIVSLFVGILVYWPYLNQKISEF
ncbi:diacylglycerol kinase [Epilithonimonas mollis]|uniref:Diacylglycerol kinase (ATP) n=1 Tax=Epilithonimonas mollis TaxID=216903 RepID=A0A1M6SE35_9FLAO|nr:diacylglycerol kinase family protein [Epilithonimonas mollis]SHK42817.1 diacylglycerol kinase (ATP) [Epilithonimonas mollis]